ncbi:DUF2975 domain-containing protein [Kribbella pittospori]|uniref:DUF2975 domain-containing protein n=1 Tax=Kribbella pittospori TaxID=722689 RepID=A0A4R0JNS7_9ACTN|nr:DUF2975 domain-containing protein [Kribbella pittospori]
MAVRGTCALVLIPGGADWRGEAACVDQPANTFPDESDIVGKERARAVCGRCRVTEPCLLPAFASRGPGAPALVGVNVVHARYRCACSTLTPPTHTLPQHQSREGRSRSVSRRGVHACQEPRRSCFRSPDCCGHVGAPLGPAEAPRSKLTRGSASAACLSVLRGRAAPALPAGARLLAAWTACRAQEDSNSTDGQLTTGHELVKLVTTNPRRSSPLRETAVHATSQPCYTYRRSIYSNRNPMEGRIVGMLTVRALRAVLVVVLAGTVFVQASMVWALATDPEDGSLPLTPLRVITILGMVSVQVALVCVWRLVTMVRRGTVFSNAAFRYVDVLIGAIVAAALVWFAVTVLNAPGQRADPGVTVIMGGVGVAILGVALIVLVLRMLLAQAVARDAEATQMQDELNELI